MSIAQMIGLLVKLSVLSTVFALGLNATLQEITYLVHRPGLFVRSLLAMYLLTPLATVLLMLVMPAPRPVEIAVLLMAISAGMPALPKKLLELGGHPPYIYSLAVIMALLAIVTVPVSLALLGAFFGGDARVSPGQVASMLTMVFFAPLVAGMVARGVAPALAERIGDPLLKLASIVLLALVLLIGATNVVAMMAIGLSGLAFVVLATCAALAVGHALGGPDARDRTTLAIACAARFPGLGLLIASLNFPKARPLPIVVAYLLISSVAVIPYMRWRKTLTP